MSWARVLGTAQVCPAPLNCLMVPAAALFCKHIHDQSAQPSSYLRSILRDCSSPEGSSSICLMLPYMSLMLCAQGMARAFARAYNGIIY